MFVQLMRLIHKLIHIGVFRDWLHKLAEGSGQEEVVSCGKGLEGALWCRGRYPAGGQGWSDCALGVRMCSYRNEHQRLAVGGTVLPHARASP